MGVIVNTFLTLINCTLLNTWIMTLIFLFVLAKLFSAYSKGRVTAMNYMIGKTVIITGANKGVGFETALLIALRKARVILACRNVGSAQQAKEKLVEMSNNDNIEVYRLDLSSLWSIRQFVQEVLTREERVDVLINNAETMDLKNEKTSDDLQIVWQINHLGPFLLTNLLLGIMKKSAPSKIILISSLAHHFHDISIEHLGNDESYSPWKTYCNTKMANIINSKYLAKKLKGTGTSVNCVNPGIIKKENYGRNFYGTLFWIISIFFGKTEEEAAATIANLAIDSKLEAVTGKYFANCKESACLSHTIKDKLLAEKLWKKSEELVDLRDDEKVS